MAGQGGYAEFMGGAIDLSALFLGAQRGPKFEAQFRCYSHAMTSRPELENGDKILLPPSALDILSEKRTLGPFIHAHIAHAHLLASPCPARMQVVYPMMFRLANAATARRTHCGVLEFSAEEGRCYIAHWMMQNLLLKEGDLVTVSNVTLPKARFVKFRPHSKDFLDISNPKAVLERQLSKFSALSKGDVVCFRYLDSNFFMDVLETRPEVRDSGVVVVGEHLAQKMTAQSRCPPPPPPHTHTHTPHPHTHTHTPSASPPGCRLHH
jgi:ubiquitin fusion degradation protein 1